MKNPLRQVHPVRGEISGKANKLEAMLSTKVASYSDVYHCRSEVSYESRAKHIGRKE